MNQSAVHSRLRRLIGSLMAVARRRTLPFPPLSKPISLLEEQRDMSVRASGLRLLLMGILFGLVALGSKFGQHADDYVEDHPVGMVLRILNTIFKTCGWSITAICWILLLIARYNRQIKLQENASWRRHAAIDTVLWILASIYWAFCVFFIFKHVSDQKGNCILSTTLIKNRIQCEAMHGKWIPFDISGHAFLCSLGICLLLEEVIRFIGEPVYYFTFHRQPEGPSIRRPKIYWWIATGIASIVILAWMILFIRTALFYHTYEEKLSGMLMGTGFWWFVVATRCIILYI